MHLHVCGAHHDETHLGPRTIRAGQVSTMPLALTLTLTRRLLLTLTLTLCSFSPLSVLNSSSVLVKHIQSPNRNPNGRLN